jgi:hypothetical protein
MENSASFIYFPLWKIIFHSEKKGFEKKNNISYYGRIFSIREKLFSPREEYFPSWKNIFYYGKNCPLRTIFFHSGKSFSTIENNFPKWKI